MVLNRIRKSIEPTVSSIANSLGRAHVSANLLTLIGLLFAAIAGYLYASHPAQPYLAATALVLCGVLDVLDGAVARAMNHVSRSGSFNDSTLDRLAEVAVFAGILYGNYAPGIYVLLALGFSLLVSYARAKGDALNVKLSGIGIGERAERLIVLIVFSAFGYVAFGVYVVLILALITFIQRYVFIINHLSQIREQSKAK